MGSGVSLEGSVECVGVEGSVECVGVEGSVECVGVEGSVKCEGVEGCVEGYVECCGYGGVCSECEVAQLGLPSPGTAFSPL